METSSLITSSNHVNAPSRHKSLARSHTRGISNLAQLEPTSSDVISNLITSLSSLPTLSTQQSGRSVISPAVSSRITTNSASLRVSSAQENCQFPSHKCSGVDSYTRKLSTKNLSRDQPIEKYTTSPPADEVVRSSSILSDPSTPQSLSHNLTATNCSYEFESRTKSQSSGIVETRIVGNLITGPGNSVTQLEAKPSDVWARGQQLSNSPSKENLWSREKLGNNNIEDPVDEQQGDKSLSIIHGRVKKKKPETSKMNQRELAVALSIPVRESSLQRSKKGQQHSSQKRRSHKPKDNVSSIDEECMKSYVEQVRRDSLSLKVKRNGKFFADLSVLTGNFSTEPLSSLPALSQDKGIDSRPRECFKKEPKTSSPELSCSKPKCQLSVPKNQSKTPGNLSMSHVEHTNVDERPSSIGSIDEAVEAYLSAQRLSQKIRHPQTGRVISFSEVGDSEGFTVFCCVGMGLTRYVMAFYDELASTLKLRLITPDRPGIGDSEPYTDGTATPLSWPDDVYAICQSLKITKFSILAHSAGAIYALATALRMPQLIRGRIHLLAPWIPPSQMSVIGGQVGLPPNSSIPTSQRILRVLPTPILRAANSNFISATSNSLTNSLPKQLKAKRKSIGREAISASAKGNVANSIEKEITRRNSLVYLDQNEESMNHTKNLHLNPETAIIDAAAYSLAVKERQVTYQSKLTDAIWHLATHGANPAVDLLVCLERRHSIGFRYVDITRAIVIHHGSKDTRVPLENVLWMGKTMKRCSVRILEGESHSLMASASIMSNVLTEIAMEWEDWIKVTASTAGHRNEGTRRNLKEKASIGTFR